MATRAATAMAEIVSRIAPALKEAGFRKRRHSFNRSAEDGLTHVVAFQMGPYEPPGTIEVPPIRVNLYGQFTVNLGVFVPEMRTGGARGVGQWIPEYYCQLRHRLGEFITDGQNDIWWSLDHVEEAATDVEAELLVHGLPWLDALQTRVAVLDEYRRRGRAWLGMNPSARIDIALLLLLLGRTGEARNELRAHWEDELHPAHRKYLVDFLEARGLDDVIT